MCHFNFVQRTNFTIFNDAKIIVLYKLLNFFLSFHFFFHGFTDRRQTFIEQSKRHFLFLFPRNAENLRCNSILFQNIDVDFHFILYNSLISDYIVTMPPTLPADSSVLNQKYIQLGITSNVNQNINN